MIRVQGTTGLHPDSAILTQGTTDVQNGRGHPKEQWQQENHKALIDGRNVGMALFENILWIVVGLLFVYPGCHSVQSGLDV